MSNSSKCHYCGKAVAYRCSNAKCKKLLCKEHTYTVKTHVKCPECIIRDVRNKKILVWSISGVFVVSAIVLVVLKLTGNL